MRSQPVISPEERRTNRKLSSSEKAWEEPLPALLTSKREVISRGSLNGKAGKKTKRDFGVRVWRRRVGRGEVEESEGGMGRKRRWWGRLNTLEFP